MTHFLMREAADVGIDFTLGGLRISLGELWTAAAVVIGFQLTAFTWRIEREVEANREENATWFPIADYLNVISLIVLVVGVFVLPIVGVKSLALPLVAFALSLILLAGYPLTLVGHYRIFRPRESDRAKSIREKTGKTNSVSFVNYFPGGEYLAVLVVLLISGVAASLLPFTNQKYVWIVWAVMVLFIAISSRIYFKYHR